MAEAAEFTEEKLPDGSSVLRITGSLIIATAGAVDAQLRGLTGPISQIDLSGTTSVDTPPLFLRQRAPVIGDRHFCLPPDRHGFRGILRILPLKPAAR